MFKIKTGKLYGGYVHPWGLNIQKKISKLGKEKVDLILTSPSYGDSHTTVA